MPTYFEKQVMAAPTPVEQLHVMLSLLVPFLQTERVSVGSKPPYEAIRVLIPDPDHVVITYYNDGSWVTWDGHEAEPLLWVDLDEIERPSTSQVAVHAIWACAQALADRWQTRHGPVPPPQTLNDSITALREIASGDIAELRSMSPLAAQFLSHLDFWVPAHWREPLGFEASKEDPGEVVGQFDESNVDINFSDTEGWSSNQEGTSSVTELPIDTTDSRIGFEHPAAEAWNANPPQLREQSLSAAEEIVARLEARANHRARSLSDWDRWMLRHSVFNVMEAVEQYGETHSDNETDAYGESLHSAFIEAHRRLIPLVRECVTQDKCSGVPTVVVRKGLRLPVWWQDRYAVIYSTNLPWTVSGILQSAFMGSPELGERKPWTSK